MIRLARLTLLAALIALAAPVHAQDNTPEKSPSAGATWTYGPHPLWGVSAFVTVGGESVGVRCLPDRGFAHPAAALVLTSGLVRPHPAFAANEAVERFRFLGEPAMGEGMITRTPGGYFERMGSTCEVNLDSFRTARALLFYDESIDAMALDDETAETAPGLIARIPLDGARAAIEKLVRACPAIRKDIQNGCGI
ncbi:MAG: hypothetical protein HC900_02945 [Methylacidiphilales bacterium]|nr:hypothetical protein [Candidatus Methylacidiphilales bacterium]